MPVPNAKVGQRIILAREIERFPHFAAPAGLRGTIVQASESSIGAMMDNTIVGCEEWNNTIYWYQAGNDNFDGFEQDVKYVFGEGITE